MSLLSLPEIRADFRLPAAQFDLRADAMERWQPDVHAADDNGEASISIYDVIGESWDGGGVTAKRISAALRAIGQKDVSVNINTPGGDFFEGVAIYNLLRQHQAKVTIRVLGLAASAGSVIAMAGDDILMGDGSWLMVHNAWGVAIGNRHDMRASAAQLEPFDAAMAKVYSKRAGITEAEATAMMDAETWIGADQAVADGFATGKLPDKDVSHGQSQSTGGRKALAMIEASMAKAGYSRSTRRDALKSLFSGTPSAAATHATPCAGADVAALLQTTIDTLKGL